MPLKELRHGPKSELDAQYRWLEAFAEHSKLFGSQAQMYLLAGCEAAPASALL